MTDKNRVTPRSLVWIKFNGCVGLSGAKLTQREEIAYLLERVKLLSFSSFLCVCVESFGKKRTTEYIEERGGRRGRGRANGEKDDDDDEDDDDDSMKSSVEKQKKKNKKNNNKKENEEMHLVLPVTFIAGTQWHN